MSISFATSPRQRRFFFDVTSGALDGCVTRKMQLCAHKIQRHSKRESLPSFEKINGANGSMEKNEPHLLSRVAHLPGKAVKVYADYARRLWTETNIEARQRVADSKAAMAVRQVQHILRTNNGTGTGSSETRQQLLEACDALLLDMGNTDTDGPVKSNEQEETESSKVSVDAELNGKSYSKLNGRKSTEQGQSPFGGSPLHPHIFVTDESKELKPAAEETNNIEVKPVKKKSRSVLFGAFMGLGGACWVFSGNYVFTILFTLMTVLGQLEYYRMVQSTGVYPARRISIIGACSMYVTALFAPQLHELCLPTFGIWAMIWFLTMKRTVTTIPEIASTFTGMFYLGYVPSFWVRTRLLGRFREPTRVAALAGPMLGFIERRAKQKLPNFIPKAVHVPITAGAIFIFWSWLSLAFSDVAAYFVGRRYGRTKLGQLSPAAGMTSPNKTVEGVLGGCAVSAVLAMAGAWVQKWPYWALTGALHGVLLGLLGLTGDLTASMLKRDAGLKDFGDLIPEHGGILDRVDSFIWAAPYSYLVMNTVLPALRRYTVG